MTLSVADITEVAIAFLGVAVAVGGPVAAFAYLIRVFAACAMD